MERARNEEVRRITRRARLPENARCRVCEFDDALQQDGEGVICYECASAAAGRATCERQHLLGRKNDSATIGLSGNIHRVVDDLKYDWPANVRRNVSRDPLLWIAALMLAARDLAAFCVDRAQQVADWLSLCSDALRERFGERWWETIGLPQLWAEEPFA